MNVRAKFTVQSHQKYAGTGVTIRMTPVSADDVEENQRFHKYTPSGELTMYVDNPAVVEGMPIGSTFYLDFTPVAK